MADESSSEALSPNGRNILSAGGSALGQTYDSLRHPTGKEGVFNALKKVTTGKNLYEIDRAEPSLKMLKPSSIADAVAMAGMKPGVQQHIVRGDSVYHYFKNRLRYVDGNEGLYVKGHKREQIEQFAILDYLNKRTVTVGTDDQLTVKGRQDIFVLGKSTEQYVGTHEVTAPEEFEWKQLERGFSALKVDMAGFGLDIHMNAADIHLVDAEVIMAETRSAAFSDINKAMKVHLRILLLAAALELAIVGRLNGAPDFGVGTPLR